MMVLQRKEFTLMTDRGIVFNIQHFSIHDGPGIRTTVFLKVAPWDVHGVPIPNPNKKHLSRC